MFFLFISTYTLTNMNSARDKGLKINVFGSTVSTKCLANIVLVIDIKNLYHAQIGGASTIHSSRKYIRGVRFLKKNMKN